MLQIKDFRETRVNREALEEGRQEGRQEGREEGRQEGREQERERLAVRLLARKLPVAEVAELTGLPVRRVRTLKRANGSDG